MWTAKNILTFFLFDESSKVPNNKYKLNEKKFDKIADWLM